jgi:hypothetical protein
MNELAVYLEDTGGPRMEEPHRVVHNRIEDRLQLCLRLADDSKDLRRRGLAIERFREVAITSLQLLEQSDVLDGDDSLRGKCLEQGNLGRSE